MHLTSEWSIGKTCAQNSLESKTADWGDVYNGAVGSCGGTGATGKKTQLVCLSFLSLLSSLLRIGCRLSVRSKQIRRLPWLTFVDFNSVFINYLLGQEVKISIISFSAIIAIRFCKLCKPKRADHLSRKRVFLPLFRVYCSINHRFEKAKDNIFFMCVAYLASFFWAPQVLRSCGMNKPSMYIYI